MQGERLLSESPVSSTPSPPLTSGVSRPTNTSTTLKSYLHLTDPIFLQGEWKHSWFDVARQQMLLFKDSIFYLWSPCAVDPGPTFFYTDTAWPVQMLLAKVSIDSQLLAIQYSKTSIYVVDTIGGKKWKVDIKYFTGNEILPNGIIWSEHGGNSQDLIIVTSRGLELYKVSTARGQCKLSRSISLKTHFFWYEPNFRVILVAVTTQNYALELTGFFLRYDMSDMPRLELPPPDRMPSFILGTGAGPQDVKLLTLYGKLYCAVRYAESGGDTLTLYHLSKAKAERVYQFSLHMSSDVMLSVTDNILCCHCLHFNVSLLFDLKLQPTQGTNTLKASDADYLCGACTMTVDNNQIKSPSIDLDTLSKNSHSPQSTSPLKDNTFIERAVLSSSPGLPRTQSWTGVSSASQQGEWSDAVGVGGDLGLDSLNFTSHASFPPVEPSTAGVNVNTGGFSRSRHNSVSSSSGHLSHPHPPPSPTHRKSYFHDGLSDNSATQHSQNSEKYDGDNTLFSRSTLLSPVKSLNDSLRHTTEPYSGDWQIIFPYWVWIPTTRCLLKIKCNLSAISASFHEPRRVVNFLSLRGSPVTAPRPTFFADYEDSFEAKKILLTRLLSSIEDQSLSSHWVNTLIDELIHNYALEYHRRSVLVTAANQSQSMTIGSTRGTHDDENMPNEVPSLKNEGSGNGSGSSSSSGGSGYNTSPTSLASPSSSSISPLEVKEEVQSKPRRRLFNSMKSDGPESSSSQDTQQFLYLQSTANGVPHRKMSMNTQTIASLHLSRLKEQQEMKGTSPTAISNPHNSSALPSPSMQSLPQLEPNLDVHIFFPEIFTIGLRSFGKKVNSEATSLPLSAPPPLSVIRNEETSLICTQTEIFSFVLLPLALRFVSQSENSHEGNKNSNSLKQQSNIDKLIWFLHSIISTLRSHSIPANVSLSLLVVNLLCYQKKFLEIAHSIQLQFLSDSPELAFSILDMSDMIEEEYLMSPSSSSSPSELFLSSTLNQSKNMTVDGNKIHKSTQHHVIQMRELKHSLVAIRQVGLDLLWRTQDKVTVIRWMLSHGLVMDAISLCTKIRGQWRAGLTSVSISGLDFFRSAMSEICYLRQIGQLNSGNYMPLKFLGKNSFLRSTPSWRKSQSDINLLLNRSLHSSPSESSSSSSINSLLPTTVQLPSPLSPTPSLTFLPSSELTSELESIRFEANSTEQQGVHLLSAVYKFLNIWDPSLLTIQKLTGKSRLASLAHFPDDIFNENNTTQLKKLFGFL